VQAFWTADEIDFGEDRNQWNDLLTDDERHFIKYVLAFFAGTDAIVALNLLENFSKEVTLLEAQMAYMFQAAMESIHSEVYSLMIDTYIRDGEEKQRLFHSMETIPTVAKKMAWAEKWSLADQEGEEGRPAASFARRLLAFCIVEGLFFSGAFCAIYWIKQRNLLPALTKSNEFISRDEGMHTQFGCLMYARLPAEERLAQEEVHDIFRDAVDVEKEFINESIPCRLVGMNAELMSTYIEYVADMLLADLGYDRIYGSKNPFSFMELIGMSGRSNFFEERSSQYQRADKMNANALTFDEKSILKEDDF
jgi:ribonucleotide reductase beta subunit family protein with ferritin-like domain